MARGNVARALTARASACALAIAASGGANAADIAVQPPPLPVTQMWDGLYAGVSFGPSWLRAGTSTLTHSVTTSTTVAGGTTLVQTTTTDTLSNARGSNWGAQSDLYLGYNFRLGGNFVAGMQVEGTIANNQAQLNGTQSSFANRITTLTPQGTTTSSSTLTNSTVLDGLAERWAVSALARLGWLVDPRDLVYVVGGYTYGGFEWGTRTFGLNGATVGAGWEREIAPGWTLKAEYRYTRFQDRDLEPRASVSTTTQNSFLTGGLTQTFLSNVTSTSTDRVSGLDLHALRFGITHYFGADALASAPVAYTKGSAGSAADVGRRLRRHLARADLVQRDNVVGQS